MPTPKYLRAYTPFNIAYRNCNNRQGLLWTWHYHWPQYFEPTWLPLWLLLWAATGFPASAHIDPTHCNDWQRKLRCDRCGLDQRVQPLSSLNMSDNVSTTESFLGCIMLGTAIGPLRNRQVVGLIDRSLNQLSINLGGYSLPGLWTLRAVASRTCRPDSRPRQTTMILGYF